MIFMRPTRRSNLAWLVGLVVGVAVFASGPARAREGLRFRDALGGLRIGGHVHTLASGLEQEFLTGGRADTGAVDVSSLELELTASPVVALDGRVVLLMEEGLDSGRPGQDFDVDQAYVVVSGNHRVLSERVGREGYDACPFYLRAGKFYVPFGVSMDYHTFDVVSEPQTLALAETLESAFQLGFAPGGGLQVYGGVFSGAGGDFENGSPADDDLDDVFVGVDYEHGHGMLNLQWVNNLNNSIALTTEAGPLARAVDGLSLYTDLQKGPARLQLAHVRALDEYTAGPLTGGAIARPEPSATTVEFTWDELIRLGVRSIAGTLVYEQTDEWLDHPEQVYGAVLDVPLAPGATGSLEYLRRDYDPGFSTRLEEERLVSFRLAVGFGELLGVRRRNP